MIDIGFHAQAVTDRYARPVGVELLARGNKACGGLIMPDDIFSKHFNTMNKMLDFDVLLLDYVTKRIGAIEGSPLDYIFLNISEFTLKNLDSELSLPFKDKLNNLTSKLSKKVVIEIHEDMSCEKDDLECIIRKIRSDHNSLLAQDDVNESMICRVDCQEFDFIKADVNEIDREQIKSIKHRAGNVILERTVYQEGDPEHYLYQSFEYHYPEPLDDFLKSFCLIEKTL